MQPQEYLGAGGPVELLIIVGLMLGLWPGELLGPGWVDVDLEEATVKVTTSLKRDRRERQLITPSGRGLTVRNTFG